MKNQTGRALKRPPAWLEDLIVLTIKIISRFVDLG